MTLFKQLAREAFPRMPEEIFELWLDQRIENNGWPPVGPTWRTVLGFTSFRKWQEMDWREQTIALHEIPFTQTTSSLLRDLTASVFDGALNQYTQMIADSQFKVKRIQEYIAQHRKLPSKLIFIVDAGRYEIIDGCHRMATYIYYRRVFGNASPVGPNAIAWVGSAPAIAPLNQAS